MTTAPTSFYEEIAVNDADRILDDKRRAFADLQRIAHRDHVGGLPIGHALRLAQQAIDDAEEAAQGAREVLRYGRVLRRDERELPAGVLAHILESR